MGTVTLQPPGCRDFERAENPCPNLMPDGGLLLTSRPNPDGYFLIFLADDEWGNQKMQEVAEEFFAACPDAHFVQVYEHGGWQLGFRRDGSIWTTANDAAVLKKALPQPTAGLYGELRREWLKKGG